MGTEAVTVDVTYTINSYLLTINYLYADGTTAATTYTDEVNYNEAYSVESPAITGYTADQETVIGTMGTEAVTVDVTYTINSYLLTINYKYADGTQAATTYTDEVNYNEAYSVESPAITGYTADQTVVTGTMGANDVTIDVTYTVNSYEIIATVNPSNGGSITGAGTYNHFSTCSLTAMPSDGYHFVNWTEGGTVISTNSTLSFMVTGGRTLVANFSVNSYEITVEVNPSNGGSVTGAGTFNHFETCTLTAAPANGFAFVGWSEDWTIVSTDATYSFMVTGERTLVAQFELVSYEVTAEADPTEGGTITGAGSYTHFALCTLTAEANPGYTFVNWTRNGTVVSTEASYGFMVTGDADFVAHFSRNTYVITAIAEPKDSGEVTGGGTFYYGDICTLTVTPNDGYKFVSWTLNGEVVSEEESYSFAVTESGDYIARMESTEGIVEHNGITVSLYPNPASEYLTIEASEPVKMLEIYTINGTLVSKQNNCSEKMEINVENYAIGTYMIRLTTENGVEIRRFVKE